MEVKVLGTCCATCNATYDALKRAATELNPTINVEQVEDVMQILSYNVVQTPAIVIDGQVVSVGKHLNLADAKKMLDDASKVVHVAIKRK